jgi:hypothetical protein
MKDEDGVAKFEKDFRMFWVRSGLDPETVVKSS